jgi:benzoylformate decarboxylase
MGAEYVVDAVRRAFRGYTVVDESVSFIPTMKSAGFYAGPLSYFSSRSQQLGWGLAAAIGVALRRPKTVVVLGDGALQYSVQALWTLARYRIPAKLVVVNNGGYSILKSYAKANHPALARAEFLEVPGVDVPGLARAFGLPASTVGSPSGLDGALTELERAEGPALLNIEVDRSVPDLFS